MARKIIKIGNSLGVIIPKEIAEQAGWRVGEPVEVSYEATRGAASIKKKVSEQKPKRGEISQHDREVIEWTDRFISKYNRALRELANE